MIIKTVPRIPTHVISDAHLVDVTEDFIKYISPKYNYFKLVDFLGNCMVEPNDVLRDGFSCRKLKCYFDEVLFSNNPELYLSDMYLELNIMAFEQGWSEIYIKEISCLVNMEFDDSFCPRLGAMIVYKVKKGEINDR